MNRILIALVLAFSLSLTTTSLTHAEDVPGPSANQADIIQGQKELNKAIKLRQINYLLNLKREHKGKMNQLAEHNYNLYRNNVDTVQTKLNREGPMQDSSYYAGQRPFSNPSLAAPNNNKRNFRVRALDYFVEGGDAGKEVLTNNVLLGSQHSVERAVGQNQIDARRGSADLISSIRQLQRSNYAKSNPGSKFVPFSQRSGDATRNYLHPYMRSLVE